MENQTRTREKEQESKPLAHPSPSPTVFPISDEEANTQLSSSHYLRKRRLAFWCCGCCGAFALVLGLIILILAFTVFKVKDPVLTLNTLYLNGSSADLRNPFTDPLSNPLSLNATLTADISLKNPNVASFKYDKSATDFYYEGQTVGVAYVPEGEVGAHKTESMNATVDLLADRIGLTNATGDVLAGRMLKLRTFTDVSGRINVWGIYKRDLEIRVNCSLSVHVGIGSQEIKNKVCVADVR